VIHTYKNILLAIDGSDNNKVAAIDAVDIAKSMGAKLTAAYVVIDPKATVHRFSDGLSSDALIQEGEKAASDAFKFVTKKAEEAGIEFKTQILLANNPGNAIVAVSSEYDLVVCGSLGLSGVKKALMGSVSSTIARNAECPVLISRSN